MGFEGLMIETHPDPQHALSDSAQQITPAYLGEILKNLSVRDKGGAEQDRAIDLEQIRQEMDNIDAEIVDLIARRMELSDKIGHIKKACNIARLPAGTLE